MPRFTKELRQRLIREFAVRHNGTFNPTLFLEEVERTGEAHEAYAWFEWDDATAARRHRIEQAREFARDLKVTFTVEEVGRNQAITVRQLEAPFAVSPTDHRAKGGGYMLIEAENPGHLAEIAKQAASDLRAWARRYDAVLSLAGLSAEHVEKMASALDRTAGTDRQTAA